MTKTFFVAALVLLLSCTKERLKGSGAVTSEERNLSNFTGVLTSGANNIYIEKGTSFRVLVKGYSNLLPYFETVVNGSTLQLRYRDGMRISNDNIEVFITMPQLQEVNSSGSSQTEVKGGFTSQLLKASLSGSGKIHFQDGAAALFLQNISGSGHIKAFGVVADKVDVLISGSGSTEVSVVTNLKAQISGSGTVFYKGTPQIESNVSGSGKLVSKN